MTLLFSIKKKIRVQLFSGVAVAGTVPCALGQLLNSTNPASTVISSIFSRLVKRRRPYKNIMPLQVREKRYLFVLFFMFERIFVQVHTKVQCSTPDYIDPASCSWADSSTLHTLATASGENACRGCSHAEEEKARFIFSSQARWSYPMAAAIS